MLIADINSVSILDEEKSRTILKDIKFDVEKGNTYTILGKNGSGKSTLIKSLTALLPSDHYEVRGKVLFNGTDLLNISADELREFRKNNIRYVLQDVANSLDPLKKIKYYFDLSEVKTEQIEEQLNYFLLPEYKKLSVLHSYELSGGMAQRLLIVLALLANPDILILDEPTSGVDYVLMNLLLLRLREFIKDKDKLVLIVTQDINFAIKSSDYIAYLTDGKLSQFFPKDNLINSADEKVKNLIDSFKEISNVSA
jgi:ABC-type glutathione transport system ATPase component